MSDTPWYDAWSSVSTVVSNKDADYHAGTVGQIMEARIRAAFAHLIPVPPSPAPGEEALRRLDEIEARWARATPGPWSWFSYGEKCYGFGVGQFFDEHDQPVRGHVDDSTPGDPIAVEDICEMENQAGGSNAPAIAAAPDDIAWLCAQLRAALAAAPAREPLTGEQVAQWFHEAYERLAPEFGYRTREASAKPWADVPENNRRLMVATAWDVLAQMALRSRPGEQGGD